MACGNLPLRNNTPLFRRLLEGSLTAIHKQACDWHRVRKGDWNCISIMLHHLVKELVLDFLFCTQVFSLTLYRYF